MIREEPRQASPPPTEPRTHGLRQSCFLPPFRYVTAALAPGLRRSRIWLAATSTPIKAEVASLFTKPTGSRGALWRQLDRLFALVRASRAGAWQLRVRGEWDERAPARASRKLSATADYRPQRLRQLSLAYRDPGVLDVGSVEHRACGNQLTQPAPHVSVILRPTHAVAASADSCVGALSVPTRSSLCHDAPWKHRLSRCRRCSCLQRRPPPSRAQQRVNQGCGARCPNSPLQPSRGRTLPRRLRASSNAGATASRQLLLAPSGYSLVAATAVPRRFVAARWPRAAERQCR